MDSDRYTEDVPDLLHTAMPSAGLNTDFLTMIHCTVVTEIPVMAVHLQRTPYSSLELYL